MKKKTSTVKKVAKSKAKPSQSPVEKLFHGVTFVDLLIPIAIIAGALIVGGSVLAVNNPHNSKGPQMQEKYVDKAVVNKKDDSVVKKNTTTKNNSVGAAKVLPVTEDDHVRGASNPKVTIVEYSDFDCPFCVRVHESLQTVVKAYEGDVAWVYRHFPLPSLHPNAEKIAQASECVAAEGGNDAFWKFADGYFTGEIGKDLSGVEGVTGVSKNIIESCVADGTYAEKVAMQMKNAKDTGGTGTPWSVLIGPNGSYSVVKGAQPLDVWKREIDALLSN